MENQHSVTMADAKRDFSHGLVRSFRIDRTLGKSLVMLTYANGHCFYLADARERRPRLFKTLDAAVSALEQIGLQVVRLEGAK